MPCYNFIMKIKERQKSEIKMFYKSGLSITELAKKYNVARGTITWHLDHTGQDKNSSFYQCFSCKKVILPLYRAFNKKWCFKCMDRGEHLKNKTLQRIMVKSLSTVACT